jgi:1-phosphofructokinase
MARILVVGLNPAWQKMLRFEHLQSGGVNRARAMQTCASGKGINMARVLISKGHEVLLLQILGGANGESVLAACEKLKISSLHARVEQETRCCTTLMETGAGRETEIIEPFRIEEEGERVSKEILALAGRLRGTLDCVIFAGQPPDGLEEDLYEKIHMQLSPRLSILDAYKGLAMSFFRAVDIVKINRRELEHLRSVHGGFFRYRDEGDKTDVLITDGEGEAKHYYCGADGAASHWKARAYRLPQLTDILNCIGAGDTVTAGVAHFRLYGENTAFSFQKALAMGSASCLQVMPGDYREEDFNRIVSRIRVKEEGNTPV